MGAGDGLGDEGAGVDGAGDGLEGAGVLLPPPLLAFFFGAFFLAGAGSEPDVVNETICGAGATLTGVTADGAAALSLLPPVALPMPNAAPKATTTTAAAAAAKAPGLIRCTASAACWSRGSCSGWWRS